MPTPQISYVPSAEYLLREQQKSEHMQPLDVAGKLTT